MGGPGYTGTPRKNKERAVRLVFRRTEDNKHCAGVDALLLTPEQALLTGSRDSTIKRWVPAPGQQDAPACDLSYEGHADWVNSIAIWDKLLFSASNDKTVRVWDRHTGHHYEALSYHSDFVTSLAAATSRNYVVSAGLRGEIFIIDVATGQTMRLRPKVRPQQQPNAGPQQSASVYNSGYGVGGSHGHMGHEDAAAADPQQHARAGVYSVAISTNGNVVAAGSSDSIIRLWDTRTQEKVAKLRGHTDNVRALLLNPDCSIMLSASSDGTIRLWDLSMQRCMQTYAVHSDSVWALRASADWTCVISGGRDACVYRTHLATRTAELLVKTESPVTALELGEQDRSLWVSGSHTASVSLYRLPSGSDAQAFSAAASRVRVPSASPQGRSSVEARQGGRPALVRAPTAVIKGQVPIVAHKVLSDRRHILVKDAEGQVSRVDVLAGSETGRYGKASLDEVEQVLFDAHHCPSWFTADNRLGQLCITLEPPDCFNAEEYAATLGYPQAADDEKVNLGKLVLEGAFAQWRHLQQDPHAAAAFLQQQQQQQQGGGQGSEAGNAQGKPASGVAAGQQQGLCFTGLWPKYWQGIPPAVLLQDQGGRYWRRLITQLTGKEQEPADIPTWVGDVVLRQAQVQPKESKCAFVLLPLEGSGLPSLLQSKLNAPRILQVHKVAVYCHNKLLEQNIQLWPRPTYWKPPPQPLALPGPPPGQPGHELELTCNGVLVPYDLSLSSIKKFIWRKSDDIVFHYSVYNPAAPAPVADIRPPSQS